MRFLLTGGNLEVSINGTFGKTLQVLRVDGDHSGRVSDQDCEMLGFQQFIWENYVVSLVSRKPSQANDQRQLGLVYNLGCHTKRNITQLGAKGAFVPCWFGNGLPWTVSRTTGSLLCPRHF